VYVAKRVRRGSTSSLRERADLIADFDT
jgi:hypothetical protein